MTALEHLGVAESIWLRKRSHDGETYRRLIALQQENAILRSSIIKLERDIEALKCNLDLYINAAAEDYRR